MGIVPGLIRFPKHLHLKAAFVSRWLLVHSQLKHFRMILFKRLLPIC
jgi:hypothetical protein